MTGISEHRYMGGGTGLVHTLSDLTPRRSEGKDTLCAARYMCLPNSRHDEPS